MHFFSVYVVEQMTLIEIIKNLMIDKVKQYPLPLAKGVHTLIQRSNVVALFRLGKHISIYFIFGEINNSYTNS